MKTILASAALGMALTGAANAATVNIDNFDTTVFQVVGAPTLGASPQNPATTVGPTSDAIGGTRRLTATRTTPAGTANAFGQQVTMVVSDGDAKVGLGRGTEGFAEFIWEAGGADLVDGTNNAIFLDVSSADLSGITYTFDIDGISVAQEANGAGTLEFLFSDFAGVDLENVSALSLLISGPESFDTTFDSVRAGVSNATPSPVPLPAAGFLLLGGMGALGGMRRLKRA